MPPPQYHNHCYIGESLLLLPFFPLTALENHYHYLPSPPPTTPENHFHYLSPSTSENYNYYLSPAAPENPYHCLSFLYCSWEPLPFPFFPHTAPENHYHCLSPTVPEDHYHCLSLSLPRQWKGTLLVGFAVAVQLAAAVGGAESLSFHGFLPLENIRYVRSLTGGPSLLVPLLFFFFFNILYCCSCYTHVLESSFVFLFFSFLSFYSSGCFLLVCF